MEITKIENISEGSQSNPFSNERKCKSENDRVSYFKQDGKSFLWVGLICD